MNESLEDFKVSDRKTFINFIDLLRKNLIDHPETWENITLPDYLDAMSAYTNDIQGYYKNTNQNINAETPEWVIFADILRGASIYE